ncbi:caspase family protein [Ramlibacter sp. USB13]|uniref:Caspase family protein n=1 Tax=Ramlibacter cellulosilyticus TaxID=2764187 RepID=A0A923MQS8_9BURK|nr:caspase family protein [Ramlibacter cellulosilyticus]MBC5783246.1 caspase family protein [Ramlibacter cellulosilyticus]
MAHRSLHIGLNFVDPAAYDGWDGQLAACERDCDDMFAIARAQGYEAQQLKREQATSANVLKAMAEAAAAVGPREHFFMTYSGHGGQVPDTNGDEPDTFDETWCLHDRMLLDDELYAMFGRFPAGARIFVLSDSCHSGSVTRDRLRTRPTEMRGEMRPKWLPLPKATQIYQARKSLFDSIQQLAGPAEKQTVGASIILISGCRDDQVSYDGPVNGAFTTQVLAAWKNGEFRGTHRQFQEQVSAALGGSQSPQYFLAGNVDRSFERMRPFVLS